MWSATRISADAAEKMQINAGILLNSFDVNNPVEPKDEQIVCETTGDFSFSCVPQTQDFFEDVNNAPTNTKEGKRITGWECSLGVTALSVTLETLKTALGASVPIGENGVRGRITYELSDFKQYTWIGDMIDQNKLLVIQMDDTVSTGGVSFSSTNKGKGGLALTLTPHMTIQDMEKVPMTFYILEKVETAASGTNTEQGA